MEAKKDFQMTGKPGMVCGRRSWILAFAVLTGVGCGLLTVQAEAPYSGGGTQGVAVPAALDALYPPNSPAPVFLIGMVKLDALLSGIVVDLSEEDREGALETFNLFRKQYESVAAMVPEWKAYYPDRPVEALEAAMQGGAREQIMAACEEIGGNCHSCHARAMVAVQQKYHWGSFHTIKARDPVADEVIGYGPFKRRLATSLSGISHDLSQGQVENAKEQFRRFSALSQTLKDTCYDCHVTERRQFTDSDFQERVDRLGDLLARPEVSTSAVEGLIQEIGRESCSKCHLVHVPAAQAGQ